MLTWDEAKPHFLADGSWRDIVVANTTNLDWTAMLRWLPDSGYAVAFTEDGAPAPYRDVADEGLWARQDECSQMLTVGVPGTPKCHFFSDWEIEFDINPSEIADKSAWIALSEFIRGLARATGRTVVVTPENMHELALIRCDPSTGRLEQGGFSLGSAG